MNDKFEAEIASIINKTNNMGIIEFAIQEAAQEAAQKATQKAQEAAQKDQEAAQEAAQKAAQQKNISVVKKLLMKGKLTLEEIADTVEVPMDFVRSLKMQLH